MSDANDKSKQYFIALVPPEPAYSEALKLKHYFREQYKSKASLNSPPHITLHMPFRWKEQKEEALVEGLRQFFRRFEPFKVCLDNFSSFPPRVIFIDVTPNQEMKALQASLTRFCKTEFNLFNANYQEQPFHPHVTLAFRDLKKTNFQKAWQDFSERQFKAEFVADKVALLKHNGKAWQVFIEFPLESAIPVAGRDN